MIVKRATQRAIRLGEQDLERWGYSVETLAFLGLATLPDVTFATLRDIRGPAGLAALLESHNLTTRVSQRAIAPSASWHPRALEWPPCRKKG